MADEDKERGDDGKLFRKRDSDASKEDARYKAAMRDVSRRVMEQQSRSMMELSKLPTPVYVPPKAGSYRTPVRDVTERDRDLPRSWADLTRIHVPGLGAVRSSVGPSDHEEEDAQPAQASRRRSMENLEPIQSDEGPPQSGMAPPSYSDYIKTKYEHDDDSDNSSNRSVDLTPYISRMRRTSDTAHADEHEMETVTTPNQEPLTLNTPEPFMGGASSLSVTPSMPPGDTSFSQIDPEIPKTPDTIDVAERTSVRATSNLSLSVVESGQTTNRTTSQTRNRFLRLFVKPGYNMEGEEWNYKRIGVVVALVVAAVGVVLFLGLFPASFVYVEYHEIALLKNKVNGKVDRDTTYYPGCYVLGPDKEFVKFNGSYNLISKTHGVFSSDKLVITITYHVQYFIKAEELGQLHKKFGVDYHDVLSVVVESEVKNAAVKFSIDNFRFKRPEIEKDFRSLIQTRMSGTCCPQCCDDSKGCSNKTVCNVCDKSSDCRPIYHMEVRYFQLTTVDIEDYVSERFLQSLLLKVSAEKEFFVQNHTVTVKKTEQKVQNIKNEAREITDKGTAEAGIVRTVSEAAKESNITTAYVTALKSLYTQLNIVSEDHKLSFMMIRAFDDVNVRGNLYRSYNYDNSSVVTGSWRGVS